MERTFTGSRLDKDDASVASLATVMASTLSDRGGPAPEVSPAEFVAGVRRRIDARLEALLDEGARYTGGVAPDALPVLAAARDLTMRGGKRLRPAMLFAAIECVEPGAHPEAAADLGAALELLQTYLLIHDDWMDGDPVRRGAPSVHVLLERAFGDAHLGAATAILAGDLMGSMVHNVVGLLDLPVARRREVLKVFGRMEHEVILGQCLDVTRSPDIEKIHALKTGSYTVRGPLLLGAAVAGASPEAVASLEAYAHPLGLAFQLRDDVLGAFGSAAETGKPVGGDFREGKETLLLQHARATLSAGDVTTLNGLVGKRDASEAEVLHVRELVAASGAREVAEARITELRGQCLSALSAAAFHTRGSELLRAFATLLTDRSR